jgi:hypothetical protein
MFSEQTVITDNRFHVIQLIGGKKMTVVNNLKTTLAGLKSAQASLETFALDTDNQQAKQAYQTAAQQTQTIVDSLNSRLQEVEQEEPQYKQS